MTKRNTGRISCSVELNYARINELVTASMKALEDTAEFVEQKLIRDEVTPYRTGRLERSLGISKQGKGSVYIVYNAPYADDLYRSGRSFSRSINANAQSGWMDYLLHSQKETIRQHYIQSFKKRGRV